MKHLRAAGAEKVYRETAGGAKDRPRAQLRRVLAQLDKGYVLMVTRLDRLARSQRSLTADQGDIDFIGPRCDLQDSGESL